jgi:hypothetical protein
MLFQDHGETPEQFQDLSVTTRRESQNNHAMPFRATRDNTDIVVALEDAFQKMKPFLRDAQKELLH